MTNNERIREHLEEFPEESDSQVARYLGVHRKTVWSVRRSMKRDQPTPISVENTNGKYTVRVNGRVWRSGLSGLEAQSEYHFLRWPKERKTDYVDAG